jgi:MFS family permease
LLALLLLSTLGLRWLFLLTLIPGLAAALVIALLVREREHAPQPQARLWSGIKSLPAQFRRYLIGVGIAGVGDFSNTLLILWATQAWTGRFGQDDAARYAMAFYVGYNIVYTVSCYISGLLADHFPKRWVLAGGYALAVIPATALLTPGASFTKFAIVFGFSGLYIGAWETVESSTSATMLPAAVRGIGFGTLATVNGIGDFVSSAAVGSLWVYSHSLAMGMVIATSLIGAAIIATTKPAAADAPPLGVTPEDRSIASERQE